jgi:osmotically-inducible protein OsmY
MKSDRALKEAAEAELMWDPDLDADGISVTARDGVVTLTGFVKSFNQKWMAEDAVKRVAGIAGIVNDLEIRLPGIDQRLDPDIAQDVVTALDYELPDVANRIKVTVADGEVTLEGDVAHQSQRERAAELARKVRGVTRIVNSLVIRPRFTPDDLKRQIEEAFRRSADVDAGTVTVEAEGSKVILSGAMRSWAERKEAEDTAWRAPGVTTVVNNIVIAATTPGEAS